MIASIGTYLPVWGRQGQRFTGADEDAVTLAVAAGRLAREGYGEAVTRVVLVSRDLPLLEGGNAASLLGGLGLPADVEVVEQVGGATAALDVLLSAPHGTLVIGADAGPRAGAAAAVVGSTGVNLTPVARSNRSLPVTARDLSGHHYDYGDPRLLRDRGAVATLSRSSEGKPDAIAGLPAKQARSLCAGEAPDVPTTGASSTLFCLAALASSAGSVLAAVDQASVTTAVVQGGEAVCRRDERPVRDQPRATYTDGPPIPIALPAYDRAFDAKLRWQASTNSESGGLDLPPRPHAAVRTSDGSVELTDLPRRGTVYTTSTIHVPVPGKATPYQLVIVELADVGVRSIMATTGAARPVGIGDRGEVVLRLVATRSGIPDYGYAFRPDEELTA
ncbi:OB-fold domain-containing protein [Amycolatopsis pigmentata]|uniref:OB-fold domain-containing protein n=1 Tax=Amycolatopsis pigmentata TaxID=450801 RepID=A0ABW5G3K3_9PSEU